MRANSDHGEELGFSLCLKIDLIAQWLRRQTWNLMGYARVGSNPAAVAFYFCHCTVFTCFLADSSKIHTQYCKNKRKIRSKKHKKISFITTGSRVVPHHSTRIAQQCLTSEFGWKIWCFHCGMNEWWYGMIVCSLLQRVPRNAIADVRSKFETACLLGSGGLKL